MHGCLLPLLLFTLTVVMHITLELVPDPNERAIKEFTWTIWKAGMLITLPNCCGWIHIKRIITLEPPWTKINGNDCNFEINYHKNNFWNSNLGKATSFLNDNGDSWKVEITNDILTVFKKDVGRTL